jgi:hypothetical protein
VSKINHNRPYLRYIDNLRRELRREDRPSPTWFDPDNLPKLGLRAEPAASYPEYVVEFGKLPVRQQEIAGCAIEAFGTYMDTCLTAISLVIKGKSKARKAAKKAQDAALEGFVVAGAVLVGTIIEDMAEKRIGFWGWFQSFYEGLDRQERLGWSDFAEMLLGDSLQLYFAQQLADSPEGVERWREYFSTESWK